MCVYSRNCGGVILDEYQFLHDDLTAWKGGYEKNPFVHMPDNQNKPSQWKGSHNQHTSQ